MPIMTPRFARASDETCIRHLLAECALPGEDLTPSHLAHFLLLEDGERLAGVVGIEVLGRHGLLRSLAVAAPYRGRGIAGRLTDAAEAHARASGVVTLYLLTTTAEGFFTKRGYRVLRRAEAPDGVRGTTEFRSICPSGAVCMRKDLSSMPDSEGTSDAV